MSCLGVLLKSRVETKVSQWHFRSHTRFWEDSYFYCNIYLYSFLYDTKFRHRISTSSVSLELQSTTVSLLVPILFFIYIPTGGLGESFFRSLLQVNHFSGFLVLQFSHVQILTVRQGRPLHWGEVVPSLDSDGKLRVFVESLPSFGPRVSLGQGVVRSTTSGFFNWNNLISLTYIILDLTLRCRLSRNTNTFRLFPLLLLLETLLLLGVHQLYTVHLFLILRVLFVRYLLFLYYRLPQ